MKTAANKTRDLEDHRPNPEWAKLPLFERKGWTCYRFGEIAENIRESVQPKPEDSLTYIGLEHMETGSLHVRRWGSEADLKGQKLRMRKGDILFAKRNAYLRRVAIAPHDGLFSAHGMILRAKSKVVLPEFLPFFMMSSKFMDRAEKISVGSLSPTINWSTLKNEEFDLPPLDQQRRIAEILWEADAAEQSYDSLKEDLRRAQRSLERDLFRQGKMRREKISDVASIQRGRFTPRPRDDPKYFGGAMPFIQTAQVIASRLWVDSFDQTLNDLGVSVSKVFPKETIVMVIAGTYVGSVAKLAFESAFTDSLLGIQANPTILENDYLFYYLRHFEAQVDSLATEVAQRNLSIAGLQGFEVTFPNDLKEQRKVVSEIERFESICEQAQTVAERTKRLKQSLINQIYPAK